MDPLEQYVLGALAQVRQPRRIFEIGTYDGATTLLLARNAPDAEVFTLDLPPEGAGAATVTEEVKNAGQGVGRRFRGTDESERITQLLGDSRTFDFGPWYGTVDFVVVDGGHELDCVRADTATAFRLLKPGGVIVWDDYERGWPGVVQAVDECGRPTTHIAGTALAVYR